MSARAAAVLVCLVLGFLELLIEPAHAEKNLAAVCYQEQDLQNQPQSACKNTNQRFAAVLATSYVRYCLTSSCVPEEVVWKRYETIASTDYVEVCTADKQPGSPVGGGECKGSTSTTWGAMKWVQRDTVTRVASMQGTFELAPSSGASPLTVTLTWNVPNLTGETPCQGSGGPVEWNGPKTSAGQQQVTVMADANFTLTCTQIEAHGLLISWTTPTHYTDGTIMPDLAYMTINYGKTFVDQSPVLATVIRVERTATNYILEGLAPSTWFFGMKAVTMADAQSDLSSIVSYTIPVTPQEPGRYTSTLHVTVQKKPEPPSDITVVAPAASDLQSGPLAVRAFSWVRVGEPCDRRVLGLFLIKRDRPGVALVARAVCRAGQWIRGAAVPAAMASEEETSPSEAR